MPQQRVWLVERYLGQPTDRTLARLARETEDAVRRLAEDGADIAYLGSTAIPADETCFCLFASPTRAALDAVNQAVSTPAIRTVAALANRGSSPISSQARRP
jgi:hypothetical protein